MLQRTKFNLMCGVAAMTIAAAGAARADEARQFNIAPQPLATALMQFGQQSGVAVVVPGQLTASKTTKGISASMEPEAALHAMLDGTGLTYRREGELFAIVRADAPQSGSAAGGGAEVEALIVTAQKREEDIQDVPIAISAFSAEALDAQKIEGGYDLLKAVPNVTFSKSNYSSYNFSIRGVGTKAVSATSDPGVAVAYNNVGLLRNRLYEQEYFDVERVEVLRGPQGTLYGRNATGGVVNMITARADLDDFQGRIKAEVGNYDARRMSAMVNVPLIDDMLAIRIAGSATERDGYTMNLTTGEPTDNRDLWSGRVTVSFKPTERIRGDLIWEHFEEDDERLRTGKQLCHRDEGPATLPGVAGTLDQYARGRLGQGCKQGSLYDINAFGKPNGWNIPFTLFMAGSVAWVGYSKPFNAPGFSQVFDAVPLVRPDGDPYGYGLQSTDLRAIETIIDPKYEAKADIIALNIDVDITDTLTLSSQTLYNEDRVWSLQDYMRFATPPMFSSTDGLYGQLGNAPGEGYLRGNLPGGVFTDPQIGPSDTLKGFEVSSSESTQFSQELRLQSDFNSSINFSVGANYLKFKGVNDYYLFFNILTFLAQSFYNGGQEYDPSNGNFVYVDTSPFESLRGDGHNYFRNQNPYELESAAVFGELYWQATESLKVTAGLRYTDDRKRFTPWPSHLLIQNSANSRYGPEAPLKLDWQEFTGRIGLDWQPELTFTDDTMLYAFYSRGYKGGGMNPPPAKNAVTRYQAVTLPTFDPEYVNAFEFGAKNTLLGGALILNGLAFYYDYEGYQVSKVQDRTIANENFDADMWGGELEVLWRATPQIALNANIGYLRTKIASGEKSLDIFNRNQGREGWLVVAPYIQQTSNCILPVTFIAEKLEEVAMNAPYLGVPTVYGGFTLLCSQFWVLNPDNADLYPEANGGAGFLADISGNELPNSPEWTVSLGAEYTVQMAGGWEARLRGDYYRQAPSYARVYNLDSDRLRAWDSANISLRFERPEDDLAIEFYAKNVFDETPITDAFLNSDSTGMTTNIFTLDPRLIGLSIRKGF